MLERMVLQSPDKPRVGGHVPAASLALPSSQPSLRADHVALGSLRVFLTMLVVAHHAVLAYNAFAPLPTASLVEEPRWWKALPIVDAERSGAWGIFNVFNDGFFMALMFFISGLFVWTSLRRKGAGLFLRDRAVRLGIPFVAAAFLIPPLAYFPAYLQRTT